MTRFRFFCFFLYYLLTCWISGLMQACAMHRPRCSLLDYSLVVLTSLHSRYVYSISIVFIHYIGSLVSRSTPSVCLTSSPRPNDNLIFCLFVVYHRASLISTSCTYHLSRGGVVSLTAISHGLCLASVRIPPLTILSPVTPGEWRTELLHARTT